MCGYFDYLVFLDVVDMCVSQNSIHYPCLMRNKLNNP